MAARPHLLATYILRAHERDSHTVQCWRCFVPHRMTETLFILYHRPTTMHSGIKILYEKKINTRCKTWSSVNVPLVFVYVCVSVCVFYVRTSKPDLYPMLFGIVGMMDVFNTFHTYIYIYKSFTDSSFSTATQRYISDLLCMKRPEQSRDTLYV